MKTIIIDGLEWQADDNGIPRTWDEAVEYANGLGNGWRLPTIKELISLIDFTICNPACKIKTCLSSTYWSSSSVADNSIDAWCVYFYYGAAHYYRKSNNYHVRCVRNAQEEQNENNSRE